MSWFAFIFLILRLSHSTYISHINGQKSHRHYYKLACCFVLSIHNCHCDEIIYCPHSVLISAHVLCVRLRSPTLTTHGVRGKEKSEPRVLRVSTSVSQHPPTISCGGAKMESVKQWEMDEETRRDGLGEGSNRTESNNQLRNTREKKGN